jgi:predicted nucleic acid-binding protein
VAEDVKVVGLKKIDSLVAAGLYTTHSDFLRHATMHLLREEAPEIPELFLRMQEQANKKHNQKIRYWRISAAFVATSMRRHSGMIKLFLDTNILLSTLIPDRKVHIMCLSILLQNNIVLITNEYVIQETRKILEEIYLFDSEDIHRFMEFLRCKMEIVKTPSKEEFKTINSKDKSDRPIIFSAKKYDCVLITDDSPTKKDAKKYITTLGSKEAIDIFNIQMAKDTSKFTKLK